tara:strand:- start:1082 stop:1834 length:753 start_codon:yes stop_codon:yes gene_type:complete
VKKYINKLLISLTNYRFIENNHFNHLAQKFYDEPHLDEEFLKICKKLEKIYDKHMIEETNYTAYSTIKNIIHQKINGCIVECGVFQGQKISFFLETLDLLKVYDKDIYIIDTYEGMTEPLDNDYQVINNFKMNKGEMMVTLKKVKENVLKSNYPIEKLHFIKTDVRKKNVLVENIKQDISILRLDTDFYDSTFAILEALYFKVSKNGYLIHDDYGHWKGHYDACKEFYIKNKINPSLIRTCRKERVEIKY